MKINILFLTLNIFFLTNSEYRIILDPAGNSQYPGRELGDCYERGIALQFCIKLKEALESCNKNLNVILTRAPGDKDFDPLKNPNLANRLNCDLYLSFHFYLEQAIENISLYYYSEKSEFKLKYNDSDLIFLETSKAYLKNMAKTKEISNIFFETFKKNTKFIINTPIGAKIKPLHGIIPPALTIELGIKNAHENREFIEIVKLCILNTIENE